jgi:hypothetical protein
MAGDSANRRTVSILTIDGGVLMLTVFLAIMGTMLAQITAIAVGSADGASVKWALGLWLSTVTALLFAAALWSAQGNPSLCGWWL